jgi:hypothetical protein
MYTHTHTHACARAPRASQLVAWFLLTRPYEEHREERGKLGRRANARLRKQQAEIEAQVAQQCGGLTLTPQPGIYLGEYEGMYRTDTMGARLGVGCPQTSVGRWSPRRSRGCPQTRVAGYPSAAVFLTTKPSCPRTIVSVRYT